MTKNQIEYWRNVETNRNNLIVEAETQRANQAREQETMRHNYEMENLQREQNAELRRANVAKESISYLTHFEQVRSNQSNEAIKSENNAIARANVALGYANNALESRKLGEQITHNRNMEDTNLLDATTRQESQKETARHNQEVEYVSLLERGDRVIAENLRLKEMERANRAAEANARFGSITNLIGSLANTVGRALANSSNNNNKRKLR